MKICIISKPEHAQPHAEALRRVGHDVSVVDPRGSYPLSYDVYVCRIESVNHQSSWDVADLRREGKKVIFESSKTRILAAIAKIQEDEAMKLKNLEELTIERKIDLTIRTLGLYSPRVSYSSHQLEGLARLGLITDLEMAKNCITAMTGLNNNSLANPWTNARSNANYFQYKVYKKSTKNPNARVPVALLSVREISISVLNDAARILGVTMQDVPPAVLRDLPKISEPMKPISAVGTETELAEEEVVVSAPAEAVGDVEVPVVVSPPPEAIKAEPLVVTPKAANPKADFKEILSMMNEILLTLNIADISIVPGVNGPKVSLSQVVIRKVTNVDDLE